MARITATLLLSIATQAAGQSADLVLHNGKVITVDANDRVAEAVAVRDQRIIAVGTSSEILKLAGPSTRRVDLKGRAVTPGLIDAHLHFLSSGIDRYGRLDVGFNAAKSVADIARLVSDRARTTRAGGWVIGQGWDEGKLTEKRYVIAADLDAVSGDHPVSLVHTTGHYLVANSAALRIAGITRETKDPPAGTIDRLPDGSPSGVLKESAMELVSRHWPAVTAAERESAIARFARELSAEGMTALKDPGIDAADWAAYQAVNRRGDLPLRVFVLWSGGRTPEEARALISSRSASSRPYESTGDDRLISGGVKLFMDGSGGARTAWMWQPWNRNTTDVDGANTGYPTTNPDTMRVLIRMYHDAGMHVSVHSIGDRAIDWTMGSFQAALAAKPTKGLRHGIIHANIPTDSAIATMARLQREYDAAYPEPSATFTWYIGDVYAANFGTRSKRLNPFATFLKNRILWANGSDHNVTPFAARYGIWASIARETLLKAAGDPFGRAEAVDVRTALKAQTIWAAHQMFLEKKTGSIEVGKYADLAVWDRDPYAVPTADLKEMKCDMTIFNGKVVFER
jgi:predicted amidohydrolase YtcJ